MRLAEHVIKRTHLPSQIKISIICIVCDTSITIRITEMASFELGKDIEKNVFRLATSAG